MRITGAERDPEGLGIGITGADCEPEGLGIRITGADRDPERLGIGITGLDREARGHGTWIPTRWRPCGVGDRSGARCSLVHLNSPSPGDGFGEVAKTDRQGVARQAPLRLLK